MELRWKTNIFSYCMQFVLSDDSTVRYIQIHLRFFFFASKTWFPRALFQSGHMYFYHKANSKTNVWEVFVPCTEVPWKLLRKRTCSWFTWQSLWASVQTTMKELLPDHILRFKELHFSLVVLGSKGWLENMRIWSIIYTKQ